MIADKLQGYVTVFTYEKDEAYLKHEANIPLLFFYACFIYGLLSFITINKPENTL